ncbi:MAG: alpha/beta hydrolase [Agarilytica sp.]
MPDSVKQAQSIADALIQDSTLASKTIQMDHVRFHYVTRGSGNTLIVFVHGTPGNWGIFGPQLQSGRLAKHARLVGLDRPGWGESVVLNGSVPIGLEDQSKLIGPLLKALIEEYAAEKIILVGHSLGASLALRIAMDFSEYIDGIVALSGDLSPEYPAARWYNKVADLAPVSWFVSGGIENSNREVLAISEGLRLMKHKWKNLEEPLLVVQGSKDILVDPQHADFAENITTKNQVKVVRFSEGGHLLHVSHAKVVNELIFKMLSVKENSFFDVKSEVY